MRRRVKNDTREDTDLVVQIASKASKNCAIWVRKSEICTAYELTIGDVDQRYLRSIPNANENSSGCIEFLAPPHDFDLVVQGYDMVPKAEDQGYR